MPGSQPARLVFPRLVTDPVWSLRPWPVVLSIAEETYEIAPLPAAEWLSVLMTENLELDEILPGLLDEVSADRLDDALYRELVSVLQVDELALDVISKVGGRPWWVVLRLVEVARVHWNVIGAEMVRANPEALSLSGWLDVLFSVVLQSIEDGKRQMFLLQLEQPVTTGSTEELTMSQDEFMTMAAG